MRILGIDPGLAITGLGLIETGESCEILNADWLTINTPSGISLPDRLAELGNDLSLYLNQTKPDLAVVEKLFFSANEKTAIVVAHARGVILFTLKSNGIPMLEPTPLEMKSCITGDGRADKLQVKKMIMRELKLTEPPSPDDAADAVALALFGLYQKQIIGTMNVSGHWPPVVLTSDQ